MRTLRILSFIVFGCLAFLASAQDYVSPNSSSPQQARQEPEIRNQYFCLGLGVGNPCGGFGITAGYSPVKYINIFGGAGYYVFDVGWQVGTRIYFKPRTTQYVFRPYFVAMYGTNSLLLVDEWVPTGYTMVEHVYVKRTFQGSSIGFGTEFRFGSRKRNGFNVGMYYIAWSKEARNAMNYVKSKGINLTTLPVDITMSYQYEF